MINKKIKILLYAASLWYFAAGMFGPLYAVFAQKIGGSILQLSWAWSVYLILSGVLTIIVGKYSDGRRTKAKIMLFGYVLNALFTFGYLFVATPFQLFLVQAGLGIADAFATPTWSALFSVNEDKNQIGLEWGLSSGIARVIPGLGALTGGLLLTYLSFNYLFLIMGFIQVFATVYQAKILWYKEA